MTAVTTPDPWTQFLDLLTKAIVPDWSGLIALLPFLVLVGVLGPILNLLVLAWLYHAFTKRRARVRVSEAEATVAPRDADGAPVYPVNTPYCPTHALIYPASRTRCEIDGLDLAVRCPVDGTLRDASAQVCEACGTRFVLGAVSTSELVRRTAGPPEGGAAIA